MRKLFACVLIFNIFLTFSYSDDTNSKKETQDFEGWHFAPPVVSGKSYGAFKIGYLYQSLYSSNIPLLNNDNSYLLNTSNVYFGLQRGWVGGPKKMLMVGGYLDAGAGNTYYLSAGADFALRLLDGWIIPKVSLGYQLQHLGLPNDSNQYNIQSGVATLGVFFNIAEGLGISIEGRSELFPFTIVRKVNADSYNNPKFNMYAIMVSFTFYDFGI